MTASSHRSQSYGVGPHRTFCCIGMASVPRSRLVSLHGLCNHTPSYAFRFVHLSPTSSGCDSSPSPSLYHHPNFRGGPTVTRLKRQVVGRRSLHHLYQQQCRRLWCSSRLERASSIRRSSPQETRAVYLRQRGSPLMMGALGRRGRLHPCRFAQPPHYHV